MKSAVTSSPSEGGSFSLQNAPQNPASNPPPTSNQTLATPISFPAPPAQPPSPPGVSSTTWVQALLGVTFIIALLLGAAFLTRRLNQGIAFGVQGMKLISGVSVGPRERVVLLEVGEEWLVLGVTSQNIRTLHTLPKGHIDAPTLKMNLPSFAQWLQKHQTPTQTPPQRSD